MSEPHGGTPDLLREVLVELESHVGRSGWDQPPQIYALARTVDLLAQEPAFAASLGLDVTELPPGALTPVEQDPLPRGALDEALATIGWPEEVAGCALIQEVVMLPPEVEETIPEHVNVVDWAAEHPERREARLGVAVLRDGSRACTVRMRGGAEEADLMVGDDLAPALAAALLETLS